VKRVLLLIKGLARGGAEQLIVSSVPHLDRERFAYEVAYLRPDKDALAEPLRSAGLPVTCLDCANGLSWMARLRRLVERRRIDLVHVHSPLAAIGARLVLPRSLPLVYTEHSVWEGYRQATHWANLLTFSRNDHVFTVSEKVHSSIRLPRVLRFLPQPPIETLYHGIDPSIVLALGDGVREDLGIPDGAPVVGSVANFSEQKGHEYLVRAAAELRKDAPDVRLVLVGEGPLEGEIRRLARELRLANTVVFTGAREDAVRIANAFDVFALGSVQEGLSIALIEAMALGKPAVVTRVGGLPEVVEDGRQGLVVPPRDPAALAGAILRLLRDRPLRERLGEAARRKAQRFDIRNAVRRIEHVYAELLS
jgi:glycosyltransferase involved in cell wall biosynthesis